MKFLTLPFTKEEERKKEREEQKHNPTSKTLFLKLLNYCN